MENINVCIVGIGNCASSFYQGLHYYNKNVCTNGLLRNNIGNYKIKNIKVVSAFDIDERKVGKTIGQAIFEKPNCTPIYFNNVDDGPIVKMGNVLDGYSKHMDDYPLNNRFKLSEKISEDIIQELKDKNVDILINYLPVGSQKATEFYANCCLEANVSFLNCIPVFIASNPEWEQKFIDKGIPIIGDDMKSQFGASILSQAIQELAYKRGISVNCHIQRNIGGNTDFLNMVNQNRLKSKKISKENVLKTTPIHNDECFYHAGPSEYISYFKDNKVANFHVEMEGFMGAPIILDAQLSVIDSPNSAGIVIDAVRYLKVARDLGLKGSLRGPSAFTQKHPPLNMSIKDSEIECNLLANNKLSNITEKQTVWYDAKQFNNNLKMN